MVPRYVKKIREFSQREKSAEKHLTWNILVTLAQKLVADFFNPKRIQTLHVQVAAGKGIVSLELSSYTFSLGEQIQIFDGAAFKSEIKNYTLHYK